MVIESQIFIETQRSKLSSAFCLADNIQNYSSTLVGNPLQISPFFAKRTQFAKMRNEPNPFSKNNL